MVRPITRHMRRYAWSAEIVVVASGLVRVYWVWEYSVMLETDPVSFVDFVAVTEPRLRNAFAAKYGITDGSEATAEALAYAWEHWSRVREMDSPVGYLYRVGRSRTRGIRRRWFTATASAR